jgi:hypothetical protein
MLAASPWWLPQCRQFTVDAAQRGLGQAVQGGGGNGGVQGAVEAEGEGALLSATDTDSTLASLQVNGTFLLSGRQITQIR